MSNPTSRAVVPPSGKCINAKHKQPCWTCKLPSSREKDNICYLINEASGPEGIQKLKDNIEETAEWNSDIMRDNLRSKYLDAKERANLCECLRLKDTAAMTKVDLLQLCRDWEFRSDIWTYIVKPPIAERLSKGGPSTSAAAGDKPNSSSSTLERSDSGRCIDPSHSQPCQICLRAPDEEEEYRYQLVGDPGRKNGEKKLRKFIQMTKQWNSPETRQKVADSFKHRPDLAIFRKVVANKEAANLRKPHLIRLCREWSFKSNIWQVKKIKLGRKHSLESHSARLQKGETSQRPAAFSQGKETSVVATLSKANEYLANLGNELLKILPAQAGPLEENSPQFLLGISNTSLSSQELQAMFNGSRLLLQSSRELFQVFSASAESHMRTFGINEINVISLISSTQVIAISKMKLEATKAELLRIRSQISLAERSNTAWLKISDVQTTSAILSDSEKNIVEFLGSLPKLFPAHLAKLLSSILMSGLNLFASCQSISLFARFCRYGMYLDSLICIFGLCSDFEDQVLTTMHYLVGISLSQMISTSSVSPILQNTIQQLLVGQNQQSFGVQQGNVLQSPGEGVKEEEKDEATPFQG